MMQDDDFDWPDEGDGPQSPERWGPVDDFWFRISEAREQLSQCCYRSFVAHASLGMSAIQSAINEPLAVLSQDVRDELMREMASVHALARLELPDLEHAILSRGIEAASAQILYLSEDDVGRRFWTEDDLWRVNAAARILRDRFHDYALLDELREKEALFANGEMAEVHFAGWVKSNYGRMAANRVNIAKLECELLNRPPCKRPPLRLVG